MRYADDILHDLAGAVWRLEKNNYIVWRELGDEEEENERDHWLNIVHDCIEESRQLLAQRIRQPDQML